MATFDVIANNADRKGGHCLLDADGRVWGIDHGLCFHAEPKLRTVIWDFAGEPLARRDRRDLEQLARARPAGLAHEPAPRRRAARPRGPHRAGMLRHGASARRRATATPTPGRWSEAATTRARAGQVYLRCWRASISLGSTLLTSPTMPRSAIEKIGASWSLLTAMMFLALFIPTMCWVAPEMPAAM